MNEELIIKMVEPYLKDNSITYNEFDSIFSFLSRREQYEVTNIMYKNGLSLRLDYNEICEYESYDEKSGKIYNKDITDDEKILKEVENIIKLNSDVKNDDSKILYDDKFFLDDVNPNDDNIYQPVYKNIKQSNDILCRLLQEGNKQASQDLCIKNKRLVDKWVYSYGKIFGNSLPFEDLEQAGMIGLLKAAKKFDYTKGYQFSTYATQWVYQSITREIEDTGFAIRIPVHVMESILKVTTLDNKYAAMEMDFQQRIDAIQKETNFTADKIKYYLILKHNYLSNASLNTPIGEDEDVEIQDMICDEECPTVEDIVEFHDLKRSLMNLLDTLTEREKKIMILRFGLLDGKDRTLEQVGKNFNVTRERIRQIEAKAIRKLRHPTRSKKIRDYWY